MTALREWWSKAGGVLAALLIVMLVASPGLDAMACQDEPAIAKASQMAADDHGEAAEKHPADACIHGHCHHGSAFTTPGLANAIELADISQRRPPPASLRLASQDPPGLERPPRA